MTKTYVVIVNYSSSSHIKKCDKLSHLLVMFLEPVQDRYEPLAIACGRSAETGVYRL